jgi:HKD family nuclease
VCSSDLVSSNIAANTLTKINSSNTKFITPNLNPTTATYIFNSLSTNNPIAASGGKAGDTLEEIRQNTLMLIASQQRSVTADDYLIRALSMPSDFGAVSKAFIEQPKLTDNQVSTIETLNLYVLSQNASGQLDYASDTLKNNLRTYLSQYRMIGDNIEIKNAFIINIGVDFEIIVLPEYNNSEVLLACITSLQNYFRTDNWQINQPIMLRDLYIMLDKIKGVQTVKTINITNKAGTTSGYSEYAYDIIGATQNSVIYPSLDPSIFEIKYPNLDIKGKVVPL